jgi:hypothetical protein
MKNEELWANRPFKDEEFYAERQMKIAVKNPIVFTERIFSRNLLQLCTLRQEWS